MNDHLYKKLKRLYDARTTINGRDEYYRGLVSAGTTEATLLKEIERRTKDGK